MNDDLIELFNSNNKLGKRIINSLPTAIYITDAEGRLTHYNSAAVDFAGRKPELGDDRWCVSWKLYHTDGKPMPDDECPLAVSLKEGRNLNGAEGIAERPDGQRRWFKAYPSPLRNDNGDIIGGINMLIDVSDHKQTEQELNDFFENANVGIQSITFDGIIKRANQTQLDMLGYSRDEYVDSHIADFHVDEDVIDDILTKLRNSEEIKDYEARLQCKDNSIKHVLINSSVYKEGGEFNHIRFFTIDITHGKQVEQELRKNRNRLRIALEIDTVGVIFWGGDDFTITEVNNAFLEMSGYSREEIMGKGWRELTPEEHYPISEQAVENIKSSGKTEPYEKQYVRKDGSRWWGLFAPRHIDENEVVEFVIDITDRKEAEEEREQLLQQVETEKERLSDIFQNAPSFMCTMRGPEHVFERANDLFMNLVGEDREVIGKPAREVFPEVEGQGFFERLDKVYEEGETFVMTDIPIKLNRQLDSEQGLETRYLDLVYQPLFDSDGSISGIFVQGIDLTERHYAKEKLKAMNETLEERVEKRTKTLHSYQKQLQSLASQLNKAEEQERQRLATELHDKLGQMLTVAKMKVDGLQHGHLFDEPSTEVQELKQVVNDALKYNQNLMAELKPPPALDKEDVTEVLFWTIKKMEKQGLDITIENDGKAKPVDKEIRSMLHQSVRELLQNVSKHADTNKARLSILREKDQVKVTVEDKGKGFDLKEHTPAPTEEERFGLFNIQERMNWHGGTFNIHSEPGKGTKATLYAPLKKKDKLDETARDTKKPSPPADKKERQTELWQKIDVLLVDDHDMVRRGLRQMIENQDDMTIVAEASNGEEAVELAYEHSPDVIVMDINTPVMDGIEATKKIKSDMPNIRIIGLSLHDSEEVIQEMKNAGSSAYLAKDEAFETLCETIRAEVSSLKV